MTADLVTTIIPVYNRADLLPEAVASVLAQTHRPIEVVIVDDGSTDATRDAACALARKHPDLVRSVRQDNGGPGPARNTGLKLAAGEFIQYLDSDDLLEPRKFELQVAALQAHPEAEVCYCTTLRRGARSGKVRTWARTADRIERLFPDFLMQRGWATLTPLWRRSVCDRIGPWGDFRVMEDWEHDLRAGLLGVRAVQVAEPLAVIRDHVGERASGMQTGFTPELTRDFFRAHRSICARMRERGLPAWDDLGPFARKMFWIARMCGERGLVAEATEALDIAESLTASDHPPRAIRLFRALTRLLGWRAAVMLVEGARRVAPR